MADGQHGAPPPNLQAQDLQAPDLQKIARDWITIWQSELSALASDGELQEAWVRLVANWSNAAELMARLLPSGMHDNTTGHTGAAPAAGTAAPMASSDDRDAAIRRLASRVAELERRLARNGHSDGSGHGSPGDKIT